MMYYNVTDRDIHIENSYEVSKKDFKNVLKYIKNTYNCEAFYYRTIYDMECEWAVHNFCYNIGFMKDKTAHLDLDYPLAWPIRLLYIVTGSIARLFIK